MNKQIRSISLITLAAVLAIALAAQTLYLVQLNNKIDALETTSTTSDPLLDSLPSPAAATPTGSNPLAGYDPFTNIRQMQAQMDAIFDSAFSQRWNFPPSTPGIANTPVIEVAETEDDYQIIVTVPENGELELSTDVEDETVRVAGTVVYDSQHGNNLMASSFTGRSQFSRSIPLSQPVDPLAMETAKVDDAIVITIPKA